MKIFQRIKNQFETKRPFVAYRKPNSTSLHGLFSSTSKIHTIKDFSESGFVFAPFNNLEKSVLFPISDYEGMNENVEDLTFEENQNPLHLDSDSDKDYHLEVVKKAIEEIKTSSFHKVVISRKESYVLHDFDPCLVFKRLLKTYQNAFIYMWYHPEIGLWMGASPETLFKMNESTITTVALAGTKSNNPTGEVEWGAKEIEEQQLVVDFIEEALLDKVDDLNVQDRQTIQAGSLLHLKSVITGTIKPEISLGSVVQSLHPTPAVCGLPKESAKAFILQNEGYDRSYYTGFLGELNYDSANQNSNESHLFVNLRCMEYVDKKVRVYVGGGITKDSDPEKEWLETVNKTKTIKSVL